MFKKIGLLLCLGACSASFSHAGQAPDIQEGLWEITSTTEMPGMPVPIPPVTRTQCLTDKDFVPYKAEPGQDCEITQQTVQGNTATWVMQCTGGQGTIDGQGTVTYRGKTFDGTITMTIKNPGQKDMRMTTRITGRYRGACQ